MRYTEREQEILNNWPTVTQQDLERMNDLFPHYLFFRRMNTLGLVTIDLRTSCCGHRETRAELLRTETPEHRNLLDHLKHKQPWTCPWCGRKLTVINLSKAGKRRSLAQRELTVLLHARGEALHADALVLRKDYEDDDALTARPTAWCSSGYRFTKGEAMQVDHQVFEENPVITYERDKLGRRKWVQEPFKLGSISFYQHESYSILNREALEGHPFFRYCGFFHHWQYRPGGARGYAFRFHDFISYLTAYTIYPRQVEMLVKSGLYRPIADLISDRKRNVAAMCWEEPDPKKSFGLNKRELSWFLGVQPPLEVLAVRNYVQRHWGKRWDIAFCYDFFNLWGTRQTPMEVLRFLNRYHLDPDRFLRYLDGVFVQNEEFYATLFDLYRDYLEAAYQLGYCMEHSKVLWPERLYTAHDTIMAELATRYTEPSGKKVAANGMSRKQKYEFEMDGLRIIFPLTAQAIKREGKLLDHCVGGYAERHIKGVLTILFLRKSDQPGVPYVTIEMIGNQIQQIHGYRNEVGTGAQNPRKVHKEFLDTWLRWLRNGSKRNQDGTPKLPKQRHQTKKEVGAA